MFRGSMVAMVTPMREDGAVDDDALARLVGEDAMGRLFRVLAFAPAGARAPAGFLAGEGG